MYLPWVARSGVTMRLDATVLSKLLAAEGSQATGRRSIVIGAWGATHACHSTQHQRKNTLTGHSTNTHTMPGSVPEIPGVKAEDDLAYLLQREVADLLKRNNTNFPGAQPVSFARHHIEELCQQECVFAGCKALIVANRQ
jgi:hypothetical protein